MQKDNETYEYLITLFGKDTINNRIRNLEIRINDYLYKTGCSDLYLLNMTVLEDAVTDYFADIARLKEFQDIEHINKNKITAYISFWLLKRKPIQIICDECKDYNLIYPNEEFVTTLIIKDYLVYDYELLRGLYEVQELSKLILYFLKYRLTTSQSLELFLEGVHTGIKMGKALQKKHNYE